MPMANYPSRDSRSNRSDTIMKDATPSINFLHSSPYDTLSPDHGGDQMIFGPLDFEEDPLLSHSMTQSWDSPNDFAYHHPLSPPTSDYTPSPQRASDFDIPDVSPTSTFYDSAPDFGRFDDMRSILDLDGSSLSHWLNEPEFHSLESPTSPIPIRGATSDPQSPQSPSLFSFPHHTFAPNQSFSPSEFAALHPLPRSLSPADGSDGYLSSPGPHVASVSPAETSLRPPPWAAQLWESPQYEGSTSSGRLHQPLYDVPFGAKRQRYQPRRDISSTGFQSSSAPSFQTGVPPMTRNYSSRRGESVSISDDRDATVRRRKRLITEEPSRDEKVADSPPLKSVLKQPKLAPSAWQLYFTDWIQRHQATNTRKLNVAQAAKEAGQEYANLTTEEKEPYKQRSAVLKEARERENAAYMRSLTPDDIKKENAFRTAQRKAGRSRKSNIKDPNAPKKPLSAYFMFLQRIRSEPALVREVFGDEQETTKQSVLAAAKWRSMTDDERKPFLAQAEQEKLQYEAARRLYEEGTTDVGTSINFSILQSSSPSESPFRALRVKTESFSSESESDGLTADDGVSRYTRF